MEIPVTQASNGCIFLYSIIAMCRSVCLENLFCFCFYC